MLKKSWRMRCASILNWITGTELPELPEPPKVGKQCRIDLTADELLELAGEVGARIPARRIAVLRPEGDDPCIYQRGSYGMVVEHQTRRSSVVKWGGWYFTLPNDRIIQK